MPFLIISDDIKTLTCDAIVSADPTRSDGRGAEGAVLTDACGLSCRYVIRAAFPACGEEEREALTSCYGRVLTLAAEHGCGSVALPLILPASHGFSKREALEIAAGAIRSFLGTHEETTVFLTVSGRRDDFTTRETREALQPLFPPAFSAGYGANAACADTEAHDKARKQPLLSLAAKAERRRWKKAEPQIDADADRIPECLEEARIDADLSELCTPEEAPPDLRDRLNKLDESFSEAVLRLIDERGMTDAACYKKANLDRKHFSKIRSDRLYRPGKTTAVALAVALELDLEGTKDLLGKAGFALSRSSKFDVIVSYYIERGIYDIFEINETLFSYDQALLGA